jgi:putative drug exporter of the RND superfamily
MVLLGDANWWLPGWLDRILPKRNVESAEELVIEEDPDVEVEPVPVG